MGLLKHSERGGEGGGHRCRRRSDQAWRNNPLPHPALVSSSGKTQDGAGWHTSVHVRVRVCVCISDVAVRQVYVTLIINAQHYSDYHYQCIVEMHTNHFII